MIMTRALAAAIAVVVIAAAWMINPMKFIKKSSMDGPGNNHLKIVRLNTQQSIKSLPNELITEILSRLPAKSIAICRRVCKEWESLLRTPAFTDYFLAISSAQPRILLTFKCSGKWHYCSTPQPQDINEELSVVEADYHMRLNGGSGPESCLSVQGFTCLNGKVGKGSCDM
ncbi:hypothetical protein Bca101_101061 [Brassica carinata]